LELSVLKFLLETHGYRVFGASLPEEAIALFSAHRPLDLVLVADYEKTIGVTGRELVVRLKALANYVPIILLGDLSLPGQLHMADALVSKKQSGSAELLQRIKVMSARKRGPKIGSKRMVRELVMYQEEISA
jgi:CheY-like chemotaxis protein